MSSLNMVQKYVLALEKQGKIERNKLGGIKPLPQLCSSGSVMVPLVGEIACGQPSFAVENIEESYALPQSLFGSGELFMLRTFGDSMIDIGIKKGDLIVVRKQNYANDGDVIVAMVFVVTSLIRLYHDGIDIILLPEVPYDIQVVCDAITKRTKAGKRFSILAVAEGAISKEDAALSKKELKEKKKNGVVYPSVAYEIGAKIQEVTGSEVRVTVPGHMQRGGEPCPYDRVLATRLGAAAAELIINEEYGYMAALKNNEITKVPLSEVAGKLKTVDPNCSMIKEAKRIGISFGDQ